MYPPLMHQIHRAGRVELRAVISTDGTIQSLQIVGGDPGFYPSAIEAVQQWRYRPTILNGQPVEVETCLYTNTDDESFVLERDGRVVVGSPCSGHGFKFAPVVGEQLADLAES